ncbi:MAG: hypothetical protein COW02_06815 [Comamonadaceae bacterium CG12_big_fil_rev_8_21_14_0_65_59_15]|nr:MAG: hypothetical protein COW02_06815 [Comamonadaceae bacterium CG12_big_fil_rev_8_21_14_0_65_59_15]
MNRHHILTLCVSAILGTLPQAGSAETIFRCGNAYSQTPCAGAAQINIDDTRDPSRKQEVDAATRRDAKLAKSLEQKRIQAEKLVNRPVQATQGTPVQADSAIPTTTEAPPTLLTPKRPRKQTYKPKGFVALVPGSGVKGAPTQKAVKKRAAASK